LEHYERLLDAAAHQQAAGGGGAGAGGAGPSGAGSGSRRPGDDPRRLRPGEIDPMPEIKPARPDPVDMDEDEKEMLSEARARLANTRGKKAKRKLREKMLEEARRLATLQKLRELKAAGIDPNKDKKKKKGTGIDYATEVPFEKRAPVGFFDTSSEDARHAADKAAETAEFKTTLLNKIEAERAAEQEAKERAKDRRKLNKFTSHQLPTALLQEAAKDPLAVSKRPRLHLPAPAISEQELEEIARLGAAAGSAGYLLDEAGETGTVATRGLLADYGAAAAGGGGVGAAGTVLGPDGTVIGLVPRRGGGGGGAGGAGGGATSRASILEEARNQAALRTEATPLFGGESVTLETGTGYTGVRPGATPAGAGAGGRGGFAEGATPFTSTGRFGSGGGGGGGGSGASVVGGASVAGAGPLLVRDAMGLNRGAAGGFCDDDEDNGEDDGGSYLGDSASAYGASASRTGPIQVGSAASVRSHLGSSVALALRALPKPKQQFDVIVPEVPADDDDDGDGEANGAAAAAAGAGAGARSSGMRGTSASIPDAGEEVARAEALRRKEQEAELARRSAALRHIPPLPRPLVLDEDAVAPPVGPSLAQAAAAAAAAGLPPNSEQAVGARYLALARGMVQDEILTLLKSDAVKYPVSRMDEGVCSVCMCV
jgi:pre-mRNA-splicing factor CDC5/CEF1